MADSSTADPSAEDLDAPDSTLASHVTAMLANALALVSDNEAAKDSIAEALNALHHI